METKYLVVILILFISFGCTNIDYQKIIINNDKKTISLLNSNFVVDSISIRKFEKPILSISLKNKLLGSSYLNINNPNSGYKVYVNELSTLQCYDKDVSILIIIRKKGESLKVTEKMANNFETNPNIQVLYSKYLPCSKEIDTSETDGSFK